MSSYFSHEFFARAAKDGIDSHFREALRKEFQKVADKVIDEAVREGLESFKTTVATYKDRMMQEDIIKVILEDHRVK